ncbi:MAG: hypothetical protein AAGJ81_01365, partial [Verrucomicrobiota bacterium]
MKNRIQKFFRSSNFALLVASAVTPMTYAPAAENDIRVLSENASGGTGTRTININPIIEPVLGATSIPAARDAMGLGQFDPVFFGQLTVASGLLFVDGTGVRMNTPTIIGNQTNVGALFFKNDVLDFNYISLAPDPSYDGTSFYDITLPAASGRLVLEEDLTSGLNTRARAGAVWLDGVSGEIDTRTTWGEDGEGLAFKFTLGSADTFAQIFSVGGQSNFILGFWDDSNQLVVRRLGSTNIDLNWLPIVGRTYHLYFERSGSDLLLYVDGSLADTIAGAFSGVSSGNVVLGSRGG